MKNVFVCLFILVSLCAQAREVWSIADLRPGDVFSLGITVPVSETNECSLWRLEQSQRIEVDFEVLTAGKEELQLAVRPSRWIFYDQSPQDKQVALYFDSNYVLRDGGRNYFYLFDNHSVTATIHPESGEAFIRYADSVDESKTWGTRKEWRVGPFEIPYGLIITPVDNLYPDVSLNFEPLLQTSLNRFLKEWKESASHSLPWLLDLSSETPPKPESPAYIQLLSASFELLPNTFVSFTAPKEMPEDRVFLQMGNKRIQPTTKTNDMYTFRFFLSSPKRASIQHMILDITPADSIVVVPSLSAAQGYEFSGKGAVNSRFTNAISTVYAQECDTAEADQNKSSLVDGKAFYQSTLAACSSQMNKYWLRSAELSFAYWLAGKEFKQQNDKIKMRWKGDLSGQPVPWTYPSFTSLFPFMDFFYQPLAYEHFVDEFFEYKALEANNSIMTGLKYLQGSLTGYYFAGAVFSGYPKTYLTGKTLKEMMLDFHLSYCDREYQEFIKKNQEQEVLESVVHLHDQLKMIEPGANIKALDLEIEKQLPLKNNSGKYIILLVGDEKIGYNRILGRYETNLKEIKETLVKELQANNLMLSTSEKKLVPLADEIQLVTLYLQLEQLRIPFTYTISVDPTINIDNEEIPGMLIQPIVENAVKHGIVPKGGGSIGLTFKKSGQAIEVEITDSGDGFTDLDKNRSGRGFGLKSVQDRLSLLNKELHLNINLKIANIGEGAGRKGAKVTFDIPV